jgi:hypothetical protein
MIRNAVECTTGIFVHHDLVDSSNEQWKKKYGLPPEISHLPKKEEISYHCAEVLHQCKASKVVEGGWVRGDAWFGSVESCLELKRRFNVYSTFIIKQNVNYFPMHVQEKELPRPTVAHMLYEFLPLIDEHNKSRQNALALEKY